MVKNVILVQIHETNNYSWFSMYLENEEGKINIFWPVDYVDGVSTVEEEWEKYFIKLGLGRHNNFKLPTYAFKCYNYNRIGESNLKEKIIEKWPKAQIYYLSGFAVAPCSKKTGCGYGFNY